MTTPEKLERLIEASSVGPLLTEAIDKAYEAAFPTRKLEPGDLFSVKGSLFRVLADGKLAYWAGGCTPYTMDDIPAEGVTIIGKALDEPVEVKP